MTTITRFEHDCDGRFVGKEIYKDGECGLWYIKDHYNNSKQFIIRFCPYCGEKLY